MVLEKIITNIADLEGFTIAPLQTLEDSNENLYWHAELDKWIDRLPGLRTPRQPDGSGGSPPRAHQRRHGCLAMCRRNNFFAHGMGVGKTATSLCMILCWYGEYLLKGMDWDMFAMADDRGQKKLIEGIRRKSTMRPGTIQIVAPRHILRQVWVRELSRLGLESFAEIIECESQLLNSKAPIFIYNFDFPKLQSDKGAAMRRSKQDGIRLKETGRPYFLGHQLCKVIAKRRPPSFLIVDEIHKLREGTERTRCMDIVRLKTKRVLGLTGTPMDGWVSHSSTLLGFIYGEKSKPFPYTNEHFSKKFTKTKIVTTDVATGDQTTGRNKPVPGINHMQIPSFIKATRHLMHRLNLTDAEVKANVVYPPMKTHQVLIDMDEDHRSFYSSKNALVRGQVQEAFEKETNAFKLRTNMLALMNDLRLSSKVPHSLGYSGSQTRLIDQVVSLVLKHKEEGRRGLIGTTFIQESRLIHEALGKAGIRGVRLYDQDDEARPKKLSLEAREDVLEKFQEDPECWYLIANKELVAEGLNLSEVASYTLNCSHNWRSNIENQWLFRVVRPGQIHPWVDCYTLLNRSSIDIYIDQMVRAKTNATKAIIDLDLEDDSPTNGVTTVSPIDLAKLVVPA